MLGKIDFRDILFYGIMAVLITFIIVGGLLPSIEKSIEFNKYCKDNFPSPIDPSSEYSYSWREESLFGSTTTEPGYIKCCRNVYSEHEVTLECKTIRRD